MTDEVTNEANNAQADDPRETQARNLARDILADFGGPGFYADPEILAGRIGDSNTDRGKAIEIIRQVLRMHSGERASSEDILETVASMLGGRG